MRADTEKDDSDEEFALRKRPVTVLFEPGLTHLDTWVAQMTERRTYHFDGRVQGVGFRYTTHNMAQRYAVNGYVRNLPDGRVELVVEGDEEELESLVDDLQRRMMGFIRHTEANSGPATGEFDNFNIRH